MADKNIDRSGPGQSGAASGIAHFDDSKPGEQHYPVEEFAEGSRVGPLRAAIYAALRDAQLDVSKLEVTVSQGVVTLTGTVEDPPSLSLAEDVLEHLAGVDEVHNELTIGH